MKLSKFCKTPVYLMINNGDDDSYDPKSNWETVKKLTADIQPYNGGLAQKEYGLTVNCQKRMYTPLCDLIVEGAGISADENAEEPEYICIYAQHWDDYTMAILEKR